MRASILSHRSARSARRGAALVSFCLLVASAGSAAADIIDPKTGTLFASEPTIDGTSFRCLGAGVRASEASTYAVTYCLGDEQADAVDDLVKVAYPGSSGKTLERQLTNDQGFFDALSDFPGEKLVILHFSHAAPHHSLAEALKSSLSGALPKEKVKSLVAALPGDAAAGETVLLYTHGAHLVVDVGGSTKSLGDDEILARLWGAWLGPKSAAPSLKSSIAHAVASAGNPATA